MMMALSVFPAEVWLRIIRLSCADTSFTARALSLVSREIYELSWSYRTQSISLVGVKQIFRFYRTLATSRQEMRVVHLFVGCQSLRFEHDRLKSSVRDFKEMLAIAADLSSIQSAGIPTAVTDIDDAVLGQCVQGIISLVANSLKSLHLHFIGFDNIHLLPNRLPALEHLVLYGTHTSSEFNRGPPRDFPRLTTLCITHHTDPPNITIPKFGAIFPTVIQFTLAQSVVATEGFDGFLDVLKKLDAKWPEGRSNPTAQGTIRKKLVLRIDKTEWQLGGARNWLERLQEVAETTHRIEIIPARLRWVDLEDAQNKWVGETRNWVEADWVADS